MKDIFKEYLQKYIPITDEQFEQLSSELTIKHIKKNTVLIEQDTIDDSTFFVCHGLIRAYTIDHQGKEHAIFFAPEHWWVNDKNSFYFCEPSLFYVETLEDTDLVQISRKFYDKAALLIPEFALGKLRFYIIPSDLCKSASICYWQLKPKLAIWILSKCTLTSFIVFHKR
jgi:CRP-like cAMP-binding protein